MGDKMESRIADTLIREGILTYEQLKTVLEEQERTGQDLEQLFVDQGFITEFQLAEYLAKQHGVRSVDLSSVEIDENIIKLVPKHLAIENLIVPVSLENSTLLVAMLDPSNILLIDDLRFATGYDIGEAIASEHSLKKAIEKYYGDQSPGSSGPDAEQGESASSLDSFNIDMDIEAEEPSASSEQVSIESIEMENEEPEVMDSIELEPITSEQPEEAGAHVETFTRNEPSDMDVLPDDMLGDSPAEEEFIEVLDVIEEPQATDSEMAFDESSFDDIFVPEESSRESSSEMSSAIQDVQSPSGVSSAEPPTIVIDREIDPSDVIFDIPLEEEESLVQPPPSATDSHKDFHKTPLDAANVEIQQTGDELIEESSTVDFPEPPVESKVDTDWMFSPPAAPPRQSETIMSERDVTPEVVEEKQPLVSPEPDSSHLGDPEEASTGIQDGTQENLEPLETEPLEPIDEEEVADFTLSETAPEPPLEASPGPSSELSQTPSKTPGFEEIPQAPQIEPHTTPASGLGRVEMGIPPSFQEPPKAVVQQELVSGEADKLNGPVAHGLDYVGQKTILVVDDSPTVQKIVAVTLERKGYKVFLAGNPLQALAKLDEIIPNLVLLDINLPHMDGYQVCKVIKNNSLTKDIPVVMLSGKDGFFDKVRGKMAGANDFISKPFQPSQLVEAVKKHSS